MTPAQQQHGQATGHHGRSSNMPAWRADVRVPKLPEQARNSTFKASMAAKVARTATAQAAAPRRHPCMNNAMPIASGSMTA